MPAAYLKAPDNFTLIQRCIKVPYESRRQAMQAIYKQGNGGGFATDRRVFVNVGTGRSNIYRCPNCRKWHYGHTGR